MSLESYSRFRITLILRCWEDPVFAECFRRDPRAALASLLSSAERGFLEAGEMDGLCSMQLPTSPVAAETEAEEQLLFAFWEGVFEPQ